MRALYVFRAIPFSVLFLTSTFLFLMSLSLLISERPYLLDPAGWGHIFGLHEVQAAHQALVTWSTCHMRAPLLHAIDSGSLGPYQEAFVNAGAGFGITSTGYLDTEAASVGMRSVADAPRVVESSLKEVFPQASIDWIAGGASGLGRWFLGDANYERMVIGVGRSARSEMVDSSVPEDVSVFHSLCVPRSDDGDDGDGDGDGDGAAAMDCSNHGHAVLVALSLYRFMAVCLLSLSLMIFVACFAFHSMKHRIGMNVAVILVQSSVFLGLAFYIGLIGPLGPSVRWVSV